MHSTQANEYFLDFENSQIRSHFSCKDVWYLLGKPSLATAWWLLFKSLAALIRALVGAGSRGSLNPSLLTHFAALIVECSITH